MTARIYVAAPLRLASVARTLAGRLRTAGLLVVSHWHDEVTADAVDPTDDASRAAALTANLRDIEEAEAVLAYATADGRATFAEIGYALRGGTPVVWCSQPDGAGRNIFDSHELVTRITETSAALPAVLRAIHARRSKAVINRKG